MLDEIFFLPRPKPNFITKHNEIIEFCDTHGKQHKSNAKAISHKIYMLEISCGRRFYWSLTFHHSGFWIFISLVILEQHCVLGYVWD